MIANHSAASSLRLPGRFGVSLSSFIPAPGPRRCGRERVRHDIAPWESKSRAFPQSLCRQARQHGEAEILLACDRAARPRRGDKLASRPQLRYRDADRARQPVRILRRSAHETMPVAPRSEDHTSELQSLMRISYAVFCLKKKTKHNNT